MTVKEHLIKNGILTESSADRILKDLRKSLKDVENAREERRDSYWPYDSYQEYFADMENNNGPISAW